MTARTVGSLALESLTLHATHFACDLSQQQEESALADLRALLAERDAARAECERMRAALRMCRDTLTEAGRDFAQHNPTAHRPNLYEVNRDAAAAVLGEPDTRYAREGGAL